MVGTVVAARGEPGCGHGDPCQVLDEAELEASWPITAGDVVGRAGHGPERASVPITAGTRRPGRARPGGRGAPCAGSPAQESLLEEEREEGTARALQ